MRTKLYADPSGKFLHTAILDACARFAERTAVIDTSALDEHGRSLRISYGQFGELVQTVARSFVANGLKPGERVGIYLPYSSGTTGLSKGVLLTHSNLLTNVYQFLAPGEAATFTKDDVVLCFLPLYHIYGLNVILNPVLVTGGTLVLMPRFDVVALSKLV